METIKYFVRLVGDTATLRPTRSWAGMRGTLVTRTAADALAARAIRANHQGVYRIVAGVEAPIIRVPAAMLDDVTHGKVKGGKAMTRKLAASAAIAKEGRKALGKDRVSAIKAEFGF